MKPSGLWAVLLATFVFAGCLAGGNGPNLEASGVGSSPAAYGGLEGFVTDDAIRPISKANVSVLDANLKTATEPVGYFKFDKVPAGERVIVVQHAWHETRHVRVNVTAGALERV
ncbi:MAG: carboxypeptidase regulatory-like domain-containing protein, partial [bacterium]